MIRFLFLILAPHFSDQADQDLLRRGRWSQWRDDRLPHIQILICFRTTRNGEDTSRPPNPSRHTSRPTSQATLVQSKEDIIPIEVTQRTSVTIMITVSSIDPPCARGPAHRRLYGSPYEDR
ncbi:hypothetical protein EDD85DRAFT_225938 [Armillaria nabsnona]|nr:hypothetical protein EDD85DRAFT_225938 [Armillaria nabsnona]